MKELLEKAHKAACAARNHSYSPYSRFRVGAALVLAGGEIVAGCNVENASYGGTICAERTAFSAAVAQFGKIQPSALVLVTEPQAVPCGLCLQVLAEFCSPDFPIYLGTPKALGPKVQLQDLLPRPFGPQSLK
jgi:homotetrameric cytidine deaminase